MKINKEQRELTSTFGSGKTMSIATSGKMFKVFITGLYSNKPQSITREIWSNAYDAHSMIGKLDVPFEVTYPSMFRKEFRVRDFGPGLSHDFMLNEYCVLGHSEKEDTNDAVGKWGIGRVTPLSYTDTYSVVSRHKGMKGVYIVVYDTQGAPMVQPVLEPVPTSEPDGLEVSFPIRDADVGAFRAAARKVAIGFDVKPIVINADEDYSDLLLGDPQLRSKKAKIYNRYGENSVDTYYARMGCVTYPIAKEYIPHAFMNQGGILEFDIGDLEVTASREDLSYGPNEPTVDSIHKAFREAKEELTETTRTELEACTSDFQKAKLLYSISSSVLGKIFGALYRSETGSMRRCTELVRLDLKDIYVNIHERSSRRRPKTYSRSDDKGIFGFERKLEFLPNLDYVVIYEKLSKGKKRQSFLGNRIATAAEEVYRRLGGGYSHKLKVVVVGYYEDDTSSTDSFNKLKDFLGDSAEFIDVESTPKIITEKAPRSKVRSKPTNIVGATRYQYTGDSYHITDVQIDLNSLDKEKDCVEISTNNVIATSLVRTCVMPFFNQLSYYLKGLEQEVNIYVIPASNRAKAEKARAIIGGSVDLLKTYINKYPKTVIDLHKAADNFHDSEDLDYAWKLRGVSDVIDKQVSRLKGNSDLVFKNEALTLQKEAEYANSNLRSLASVGIIKTEDIPEKKVILFNKYPLLYDLVDGHKYRSEYLQSRCKLFTEYAKFIEQKTQANI